MVQSSGPKSALDDPFVDASAEGAGTISFLRLLV